MIFLQDPFDSGKFCAMVLGSRLFFDMRGNEERFAARWAGRNRPAIYFPLRIASRLTPRRGFASL